MKKKKKNCFRLDQSRKIERGVFEKVWKVWRTSEKLLFKTLTDWFLIGWKLASIGRKLNSINQASIEPGKL